MGFVRLKGEEGKTHDDVSPLKRFVLLTTALAAAWWRGRLTHRKHGLYELADDTPTEETREEGEQHAQVPPDPDTSCISIPGRVSRWTRT